MFQNPPSHLKLCQVFFQTSDVFAQLGVAPFFGIRRGRFVIYPTQEDDCSWKTQDGKMTKKMSGETVHSHCYAILFSSFCRCVRLRSFIYSTFKRITNFKRMM